VCLNWICKIETLSIIVISATIGKIDCKSSPSGLLNVQVPNQLISRQAVNQLQAKRFAFFDIQIARNPDSIVTNNQLEFVLFARKAILDNARLAMREACFNAFDNSSMMIGP
jgi:hypothetical protein